MISYHKASDVWKLQWSEQGTRQKVYFPRSNPKALAMAVHMRDMLKKLGVIHTSSTPGITWDKAYSTYKVAYSVDGKQVKKHFPQRQYSSQEECYNAAKAWQDQFLVKNSAWSVRVICPLL